MHTDVDFCLFLAFRGQFDVLYNALSLPFVPLFSSFAVAR